MPHIHSVDVNLPRVPYMLRGSSSDDSSSEEDELFLLVANHLQNKRKSRFWVHSTLQKRKQLGEYHTLIQELNEDDERFKNYFRLTREQFEVLYNTVHGDLEKETTYWREPIGARERLAICLRYLATGDSFSTIAFSYRVGKSTVAEIVIETCDVVWNRLQPEYMPVPTEEQWMESAQEFKNIWNFPNCIGSIDGKHVVIQAPRNSGAQFFNYKISIVLMAVVDAHYRFIAIDVGGYGRNSDGGIFSHSILGHSLENESLHVPSESMLPGTDISMPHMIVGDEEFPLKSYLMRPYPGRQLTEDKKIFNYRLSRARRVVENAFGILSARWRVYQRRLPLKPENVEKVVKATCILHNFVANSSVTAGVQEERDAVNETGMQNLIHLTGRRATDGAYKLRDQLKDYFNSEAGEVAWQTDIVRRGIN